MVIVIALLVIYVLGLTLYVVNVKLTYISERESILDLLDSVDRIDDKFTNFDKLRVQQHNKLHDSINNKANGITRRVDGINYTLSSIKGDLDTTNSVVSGISTTIRGLIKGDAR